MLSVRPALNSGPLNMPATAQIVAVPPVSADTSGLAVPNSAVRLSLGKNSALATPIRALALTSRCSASRKSGRRSSSADGKPAGTTGATGCSYIGLPRGIGRGDAQVEAILEQIVRPLIGVRAVARDL